MARSDKDKGRMYLIGLGAVALIVVLILVALGLTARNDPANGDETSQWSDLEGFKGAVSNVQGARYYEAVSPLDLNGIADRSKTLYYLIGIERELTGEEIIAIRDFVAAGGKVVIADDGTMANDLGSIPSESAGGSIRYDGHRYLVQGGTGDPDTGYIVNRSFVRTVANIGGWNYDIVAHDPMGITPGGEHFVWLKTTKVLTVIDLNDNYVQELSDKHTPYGPIAVGYEVGSNGGSIVYFSTTGIFTDNVFSLDDNEAFVRNFSSLLLPEGGTILLDQSHQTEPQSPHRTILPEG